MSFTAGVGASVLASGRDAYALPGPVAGREFGPGGQDRWPDVLTPRVLYRGTNLRAESPSVAHNARAFVTAVLADWRILPVLDDAVLCVSELVGNAVQHATNPVIGSAEGRQVTVGVRCWGSFALFLEVSDFDRRMPRQPGSSDPMAVEGRGLAIVETLSDHLWWQRAAHGGKIVYVRFHLPRYGLTQSMVGP